MIAVVSNAWLTGDHVERYVEIVEQFEAVHRRIAGYRGRRLLFDGTDRRHIVNIRFFDAASDYDALVGEPDYGHWIDRLSELVEARDPQKAILEVVHSLDVGT